MQPRRRAAGFGCWVQHYSFEPVVHSYTLTDHLTTQWATGACRLCDLALCQFSCVCCMSVAGGAAVIRHTVWQIMVYCTELELSAVHMLCTWSGVAVASRPCYSGQFGYEVNFQSWDACKNHTCQCHLPNQWYTGNTGLLSRERLNLFNMKLGCRLRRWGEWGHAVYRRGYQCLFLTR